MTVRALLMKLSLAKRLERALTVSNRACEFWGNQHVVMDETLTYRVVAAACEVSKVARSDVFLGVFLNPDPKLLQAIPPDGRIGISYTVDEHPVCASDDPTHHRLTHRTSPSCTPPTGSSSDGPPSPSLPPPLASSERPLP